MKEDIIKMAREAGFTNPERFDTDDENLRGILKDFWVNLERFAALVAAAEREALEQELLKLKKGIAANSDYIQGRWDVIGEFQDILRARGQE